MYIHICIIHASFGNPGIHKNDTSRLFKMIPIRTELVRINFLALNQATLENEPIDSKYLL